MSLVQDRKMVDNSPEKVAILLAEGPSGDEVVCALVESMRETFFSIWDDGRPRSLVLLPEIIGSAMHMVERAGKLTGKQKKQAVVALAVQLVDDWDIGGSMEPDVLRLIPPINDTLLTAEKGKLQIRRRPRLFLMRCLPF